jgi:hypothetical protein
MGILSSKTFGEKLSGVKSMFKKAYDESVKLISETEASIAEKNQEIINLQNEIQEIEIVRVDTARFASKLEEMLS